MAALRFLYGSRRECLLGPPWGNLWVLKPTPPLGLWGLEALGLLETSSPGGTAGWTLTPGFLSQVVLAILAASPGLGLAAKPMEIVL